MTPDAARTALGDRLQQLRRQRGFKNARDLATAIAAPNVTESILRNIEAGRKADLTVAQLLNISAGLGVSPLLLLTDPKSGGAVELAGVTKSLSDMDVAQFDAWWGGRRTWDPTATPDERDEREQLEAWREVLVLKREAIRLRALAQVLSTQGVQTPPEEPPLEARADLVEARIDELSRFLRARGWDERTLV